MENLIKRYVKIYLLTFVVKLSVDVIVLAAILFLLNALTDKLGLDFEETLETIDFGMGSSVGSSSAGDAIVKEARKHVGKLPYVYGGKSLETGADCSGFVWAVLQKAIGYSEGYCNSSGWRTRGTEVASLSQAKAGDIICYSGHVAIYDGNGKVIEEKNESLGCCDYCNADYIPIITIRRVT